MLDPNPMDDERDEAFAQFRDQPDPPPTPHARDDGAPKLMIGGGTVLIMLVIVGVSMWWNLLSTQNVP